MDILFSGAVFHSEWKGGEPVVGKELIAYLSKRQHTCRIGKTLPYTLDKTRSILRFIENDNFIISTAINRPNISKADVVLSFYDFDSSIMNECIKKKVPIAVTQHIYWGLCPKFDLWNNSHNCSCSRIPSSERDCKECISKQANIGPQITSSLFPKKLINNLRKYREQNFKKCNTIIVPSNFMKKLYKRELSNPNIQVIHNGINTKFYLPHPKETSVHKKQIIYAGARTNVKGYHHFIKLANEITKLRDDIEFLAFGYGTGSINKSIKDLGYLDKFNVPKAYSNAYALIFPALWDEPFAQIPLESMACGCPVIAYGSGGVPEMINNGQNGHLVSTGDFDQLLKTTMDLIENPDKAAKMRIKAREYIEENFALNAMLANYEKALLELAE